MTGQSSKVGKLRPSQVVTQHGPGAVVDLPDLSVIVAGTDHWFITPSDRVPEPRLEAFLRVAGLYRPPQPGPGQFGGVPSYVFPGWLVCPHPKCRLLAEVATFQQVARWNTVEYRCTRADRHPNLNNLQAFPARFMVACPKGHLDDFPWWAWVHGGGGPCQGPLELRDTGQTGGPSDLLVVCTGCDQKRNLGNAFDIARTNLPCTGRRPWLGPNDAEPCDQQARVILRGASNAYFPVAASALSIPPWSDPIHADIGPFREGLMQADTLDKLKAGIEGGFYQVGTLLERYTVEQIWNALHPDPDTHRGLKPDEWTSFVNPDAPADPRAEFEVSRRRVPVGFESDLADVVAATRLREVRALRAFTRIESGMDLGETDFEQLPIHPARIGTSAIPWLPGIDLRGEGVFLRVREDALTEWERSPPVVSEAASLSARHAEWLARRDRNQQPFPGMRFVLLHTLSHVLIRQLALDCGYSASALRERIYCAEGNDSMAGILIYTATSDSEGSLGGLVDQARPDRLGALLLDGLRDTSFCASDPLCSSGSVGGQAQLNGAACHACLLLAETSCENGNHLLDRSVLTPTVERKDQAFFEV